MPGEEIGLIVVSLQVPFLFIIGKENDKPGDIIPYWSEQELEESDSLEAQLPADDKFTEGYVPVKFLSRITELGVFELWCKSTVSDDSWKLEFSVRDNIK